MGLTTVVTAGTPSTGVHSLLSTVGAGTGGILVTPLLVYLLAYLNVVEASERDLSRLRSLLVVASLPLMFVFLGLIAFESLSILGFL